MNTPLLSPANEYCESVLSEQRKLLADEFLTSLRVWPVFQPIVDIYQENVTGYECLSRGQEPYTNPLTFFARSEELGVRWETEALCRQAALRVISTLEGDRKNASFFINVSPEVLCDPRLFAELSLSRLEEYGLCPEQIVLEITEEVSLSEYERLEDIIDRLRKGGFRIAIDDFGCGSANLYSIVAVRPDYLKLDKSLVRDINRDAHKLKMVRSLLHLCEDMNTRMIAEGVETREELEKLADLGVRYLQGYFLGYPRARPLTLEPEVQEVVLASSNRLRRLNIGNDTVRDIMQYPPAFEEGCLCGEELYNLFSKSNADHVVLLREGKPGGLLTRAHFMANTSGAFGYSLLQKRPAERAAKYNTLLVSDSISVVELAKIAMERKAGDVYDPVIVVNEQGLFQGTVEMRMLILRASRMEIDIARDCNPLTGLPGNRRITACLERAIREKKDYSIIYFDLNRFKEYNDVYGFGAGDDIIRFTGELLRLHENQLSTGGLLGHVGGDDFVYVTSNRINAEVLERLCDEFDQQKRQFFRPEHLRTNSYQARDRQGNATWVPLVSLSASAVTSEAFAFTPHPAQIAKAAAALKKQTKEDCRGSGRSGCRFERRVYAADEELF